ncbi:hypothetical protein, partial [Klebsiella quasipneumoniae]|uniref:hypothetical protein n=1 Tax=Klebsiella quasipneumoniae TaxID=1463165 RepID=UPI001C12C02C
GFIDLLKKLDLIDSQVPLCCTLLVSTRLLTSEYNLRDLDQVCAKLTPFSSLFFDRSNQV